MAQFLFCNINYIHVYSASFFPLSSFFLLLKHYTFPLGDVFYNR